MMIHPCEMHVFVPTFSAHVTQVTFAPFLLENAGAAWLMIVYCALLAASALPCGWIMWRGIEREEEKEDLYTFVG